MYARYFSYGFNPSVVSEVVHLVVFMDYFLLFFKKFLNLWSDIHNIKFNILTIFKCTFQGQEIIHTVVQTWPPSSSRTFPSCKIETVPIKHSLPIVPPSAPGTQHPTLCIYVSNCSRGLVWVDQALFVFLCLAYITEHNALKVHPCCSLCQNCLPF